MSKMAIGLNLPIRYSQDGNDSLGESALFAGINDLDGLFRSQPFYNDPIHLSHPFYTEHLFLLYTNECSCSTFKGALDLENSI